MGLLVDPAMRGRVVGRQSGRAGRLGAQALPVDPPGLAPREGSRGTPDRFLLVDDHRSRSPPHRSVGGSRTPSCGGFPRPSASKPQPVDEAPKGCPGTVGGIRTGDMDIGTDARVFADRGIRVGTSGWVYRDWRGPVYPEALPQRRWLGELSHRFPTIEINAPFYRLPERDTFARWSAEVPRGFVFSVKMSRYLTHVRRFRDAAEPVARFWGRATALGTSLGPVLFQQPPTFPCDIELLRELLLVIPEEMRAAFEFRHPSWERDDVLRALDEAGAAWVLPDRPGSRVAMHVTGGWSYVRFHRGRKDSFDYPAAKLRRWADRIAELPAREVFVYFNNDPGGAAVRDAERLLRLLDRPRRRVMHLPDVAG